MPMPEQRPKPEDSHVQDEWGTTTRIGYEDRPAYQPRKVIAKRRGSSLLRAIGGLAIVGGIFWGVYVVTSTQGINGLFHTGWPARPVILCGAGLLILLLEKLIR
jgi:hypothetical protein